MYDVGLGQLWSGKLMDSSTIFQAPNYAAYVR